MVSWVGMEWRPSVTSWRFRLSNVRGLSNEYWSQLPSCGPKPGIHDVVGLSSTAEYAPAATSPGSRPEELAKTISVTLVPNTLCAGEATGVLPTSWSITGSGSFAEIRSVPPTEKVRAVGRVKLRDMSSSGSLLGGTAAARTRFIKMMRGWAIDDGPASVRSELGSRSVWTAGATPGIVTSAKPTPLNPLYSLRRPELVASTVIVSDVKLRVGKWTT